MSIRNLGALFEPASVAVVGASERAGSVGSTVWRNVRAGAYAGPVYAVNRDHASVDGEPAYANLDALPAAPDLVVVCTPSAGVPDVIDAAARRGARAAIVMSAGFDSAARLKMLQAARPRTLRILGPNCLGLLSPHIGLNASFAHVAAAAGDIAFVSQSGALITAVLDWASSRQIGFSHLVSLGDHADVDFGDLLDHLASDPRTKSILLYIESITCPRKFMSAARAAARNKPVIVVKAGRAGRGPAAAASHTGALAGSDVVYEAAIRRAGMLRVDTLQDLFVAAETLARFGRGPHAALSLMTNGGGAGVLAADAAARLDVDLATLPPAVVAALDRVLPPTWSHANPIDIIGDAPTSRYVDTLRALLASDASGAVLFMHAPTAIVRSADIARACAPLVRESPGRVMACWLGGESLAPARRMLEQAGAADYETPEDAVRAFAMLATYRRNQALLLEVPSAAECVPPDLPQARAIVSRALEAGQAWLGEAEAKALIRACGIPVVDTVAVAPDPEQAVEAAARVGFPVALKIVSPQVLHKSDAGGVALDLQDAAAVRSAARRMLVDVASRVPGASIEGYTVQPMARRPHAQELIVGAAVDPIFGPVVLFGHGGTAVEVIADRAVALPPLNRTLARDLVERTRVARLLAGYRDRPPARIDAVHDALIAVSRLLSDLPEVVELDINPLWADERGVLALDARVRVAAAAQAGSARFAIAPYPAALAASMQWNGETIELRPIRPEDEAMHRRFIAALQPQDMRMRFFGALRELPAGMTARLTQIDYAREMAFIAVRAASAGAEPEAIGIVRAVADPDNEQAEFGIVVRSDAKGRGLGTLLLRRLIDHQAACGTRELVGLVLHENRAMRRLAAAQGFAEDKSFTDVDTVRLVLPLARAGSKQA